jgi:hypothetical protein
MATTYKDLLKNVQSMSGRTDPDTINNIPLFVEAAQTKLDSILRIKDMSATTDYPADGLTVEMPYMDIDNVIINGREGVMYPLADILKWRKIPGEADLIFYAVNGNAIELIAPADVSITGYEQPERLSSDTQTNAYTGQASNALLWATLAVLGVYTRDTDSTQTWGGLAENEIENLNEAYARYKSAGGLASEAPQAEQRYL